MNTGDMLTDFLAFSSAVTGFSVFRLRGTGQAERYFSTINDIVGESTANALIAAFRGIRDKAGEDDAAFERAMRRQILSDPMLGPVARNVIKLWYTGAWYELPRDWRESYGASEMDRSFVVAPDSYTEGLLWPCIGANPSGAKPFGYGMWAHPPRIETS